jgi:hypothetical protein
VRPLGVQRRAHHSKGLVLEVGRECLTRPTADRAPGIIPAKVERRGDG